MSLCSLSLSLLTVRAIMCADRYSSKLQLQPNRSLLHHTYSSPALEDYRPPFSMDILFLQSPSTSCVNIGIVRDFLVEYTESFNFLIDSEQTDPAIIVGTPDLAVISIEDEEDGNGPLHKSVCICLICTCSAVCFYDGVHRESEGNNRRCKCMCRVVRRTVRKTCQCCSVHSK